HPHRTQRLAVTAWVGYADGHRGSVMQGRAEEILRIIPHIGAGGVRTSGTTCPATACGGQITTMPDCIANTFLTSLSQLCIRVHEEDHLYDTDHNNEHKKHAQ